MKLLPCRGRCLRLVLIQVGSHGRHHTGRRREGVAQVCFHKLSASASVVCACVNFSDALHDPPHDDCLGICRCRRRRFWRVRMLVDQERTSERAATEGIDRQTFTCPPSNIVHLNGSLRHAHAQMQTDSTTTAAWRRAGGREIYLHAISHSVATLQAGRPSSQPASQGKPSS